MSLKKKEKRLSVIRKLLVVTGRMSEHQMIATNCGLGIPWRGRMLGAEVVRKKFISKVNFKVSFGEWLKLE